MAFSDLPNHPRHLNYIHVFPIFAAFLCTFIYSDVGTCNKGTLLVSRRERSESKPPKISFNRVIFAQVIDLAMSCFLYSLEPFGVWKGMQAFFFFFLILG